MQDAFCLAAQLQRVPGSEIKTKAVMDDLDECLITAQKPDMMQSSSLLLLELSRHMQMPNKNRQVPPCSHANWEVCAD